MGSGAWAQVPGHAQDAVWTEPGNWGQLTGTNLKFSSWLVCHGTGLFVTVLFNSNEKKNHKLQTKPTSWSEIWLWEESLRK